jgi:hypothetical protein
MAALTPTLTAVISTPGGGMVEKIFTVTPSSASDTIDLSAYFDTIKFIRAPHIIAGADAALVAAYASFSSLSVTLTTVIGATGAATDWTGASIILSVVGTAEGV